MYASSKIILDKKIKFIGNVKWNSYTFILVTSIFSGRKRSAYIFILRIIVKKKTNKNIFDEIK